MEVVKASDFGIEETKAKQIAEQFKPMLEKMVELEKEFNQIASAPITEEICYKAGELRKKYVKVRTGTAAIHKEQKAFYLNAGRFVDGWKNTQLFASQGIEEKLDKIERHFRIIEEERLSKLSKERRERVVKYVEIIESIPTNLGMMDEDVFERYCSSLKKDYELRQKAIKEQREEEEKKEEDRNRIRLAYQKRKELLEELGLIDFLSYDQMENLGTIINMDDLIKELNGKKIDAISKELEIERLRKIEDKRITEEAAEAKEREERESIENSKFDAPKLRAIKEILEKLDNDYDLKTIKGIQIKQSIKAIIKSI